ncbi:two-component system sensor histidine kinase NtrB [Pseudofulvimonas gallinarii]|uniref:histidine kinase n=3 Tax=Pseudofulvimonas gallinarii TaxID=634155 RepID=A0A4R3LJR4_9GAMM|nr:ATP-binding protein [Pseudofulvimonas gallinarii]TCT00404.1 two-component system nitrogen regulation sensor histidine kinase GlnL [Pseudofulvimonas gallinarii]
MAMPDTGTPAKACVPPSAVGTAAPLLNQMTTALGWLDGMRLAWANMALLAMLGRSRLPASGLALDVLLDDAPRLADALARLSGEPSTARLPDLRLRAGGPATVVQLTRLDEGGVLLEAWPGEAPSAVPVSASLRSLAHELKNPLGGLRGAAQLISRRVLDADLRTYAQVIVDEVDRLAALTGRLLAAESRKPMAAVNVNGVLERLRLLLAADGVQVERDYDPSLPECLGDSDRLLQMFLNLGRNAVEAGASRVRLRTRHEHAAALPAGRAPALRVDLIDDGRGVPESLRSVLFLPLVSGREGGTGLGLAMAHEIASEHGGRIAFESRPGHTVFSTWLPVAPA